MQPKRSQRSADGDCSPVSGKKRRSSIRAGLEDRFRKQVEFPPKAADFRATPRDQRRSILACAEQLVLYLPEPRSRRLWQAAGSYREAQHVSLSCRPEFSQFFDIEPVGNAVARVIFRAIVCV